MPAQKMSGYDRGQAQPGKLTSSSALPLGYLSCLCTYKPYGNSGTGYKLLWQGKDMEKLSFELVAQGNEELRSIRN